MDARLTASQDADASRARIERLLHLARTHLGMDVACLTEFDGGRQVVRVVDGESGFGVGATLPHADSYCVRVLTGAIAPFIRDTRRQPITRELPITRLLHVGSYIGVPWREPTGEPAGMLCCLSRYSTPGLDEQGTRFLELIAELIADHVAGPAAGAAPTGGHAARALREILDTRAAEMVFQPVVRLHDGSVVGHEALARFKPAHFASPAHAFAAAANAGLGVDLEHLAVERALERLRDVPPEQWLCVNLSVDALLSPLIEATLMAHSRHTLGIEITEHTQVDDYPALLRVTERLRAAGMKIIVDDAGAGFASLSHILQLRPDVIKLDIALTRGVDADPVRMALTRSLVGFAHDIDAMLIAEGVETRTEHEKLRELGVRLGQGFYMARPGPLPVRAHPLAA